MRRITKDQTGGLCFMGWISRCICITSEQLVYGSLRAIGDGEVNNLVRSLPPWLRATARCMNLPALWVLTMTYDAFILNFHQTFICPQ